MEENVISMQEIFTFHKKGIGPDGKVVGRIPADAHPSEVPRTASHLRYLPAAGHVRAGNGSELKKGHRNAAAAHHRTLSGVFAVIALLLVASGAGASQRTKETLARLESTLAAGGNANSSDEIVDLRKQELFSAVPWLNRWLLKLEVAPRLRVLLFQANLRGRWADCCSCLRLSS